MFIESLSFSPTRQRWYGILQRLALAWSIVNGSTLLLISPATAVETTWTSLNGGDWFDAQNWGGPIPNAPGDIARLDGLILGDLTIDLNSPVTLGRLEFLGRSPFVLTGAGGLVSSWSTHR